MFRGVHLLVVERDTDTGLTFKRIAETMNFAVRIVHTVSEAMDIVDGEDTPDVLLLGWHLAVGYTADVVLDRWVTQSGGPVCVVDDEPDCDLEQDLIVRGAWNTLFKPLRPDVLQAVLMRYGKAVLERKVREEMVAKIERLEDMVRKLRLAVIGLGFVVAAVGGVEALPWLGKLIALL